MSTYAYVVTPQIVNGDFVFELPLDNSNFPVLTFGVIPANGTLEGASNVGGQVQTKYPDRPYFAVSGANVLPMGNVSYQASFTTGDLFSIHRQGDLIRFYKNFQSSVVPVPLYETSYSSNEALRFYAEFVVAAGTADIQPEWGSVGHRVPRAYRYTANQQVDDFGSTQSSIKTRVYEESSIVGKGFYVEGNL